MDFERILNLVVTDFISTSFRFNSQVQLGVSTKHQTTVPTWGLALQWRTYTLFRVVLSIDRCAAFLFWFPPRPPPYSSFASLS